MASMPENAPFVVLAFLGTAFLLGLAGLALLYAIARGLPRLALRVVVAAAGILLAYATVLFGASLASRERTLAPGERKYFCEIDCHIAYSIEGTTRSKALGRKSAAGMFTTVAVRTWFDENTISTRRGNSPLVPSPRLVYIEDGAGRRFDPSPAGCEALAALGRPVTPLDTPLRPGESYVTELAFDLPDDVRAPRLYIGTVPTLERVLIGHEESPLHRKIWFRLEPASG